mmetsp:Transcript_101482/g.282463  ORF Transcript_101482/g.282463 Transcript_101482/m.282463 type:complete len:326 (-) Transcript_101482:1132-2109(-)
MPAESGGKPHRQVGCAHLAPHGRCLCHEHPCRAHCWHQDCPGHGCLRKCNFQHIRQCEHQRIVCNGHQHEPHVRCSRNCRVCAFFWHEQHSVPTGRTGAFAGSALFRHSAGGAGPQNGRAHAAGRVLGLHAAHRRAAPGAGLPASGRRAAEAPVPRGGRLHRGHGRYSHPQRSADAQWSALPGALASRHRSFCALETMGPSGPRLLRPAERALPGRLDEAPPRRRHGEGRRWAGMPLGAADSLLRRLAPPGSHVAGPLLDAGHGLAVPHLRQQTLPQPLGRGHPLRPRGLGRLRAPPRPLVPGSRRGADGALRHAGHRWCCWGGA